MKILEVNNHFEVKGGSERVFLNTIDLLKSHNHEVRFFSSSSKISSTLVDRHGTLFPAHHKIKDKKNYFKNSIDFIYNKKIKAAFENEVVTFKPDIIHFHIFYGRISNSVIDILKKYKCKSIMSVHEYRMLCPSYTMINSKNEICNKCSTGNYLHAITNRCIKGNIFYSGLAAIECFSRDMLFDYKKHISHFVMVSNFVKELHEKNYPELKFKSSRIYNFHRISSAHKQFTNEQKTIDITYFGRLSSEKGINTFLKSVTGLNLNVNILGTGPEYKGLKQQYGSSKIKFHGFISGGELIEFIRKTKFVIVPSEWYENNPMTVIESFSLGVPVIGSNIGGIPELVLERKTGFLFKPADGIDLKKCIDRAINCSSAEYKMMSENCFKFFKENFSEKKHYEQLHKLFNDVINEDSNSWK